MGHLLGIVAVGLSSAIILFYFWNAFCPEELLLLIAKRAIILYLLFWLIGVCIESLVGKRIQVAQEKPQEFTEVKEEIPAPSSKNIENKEKILKDIEPQKIAEAVRTFMSRDKE